jgi:hypothetical protein
MKLWFNPVYFLPITLPVCLFNGRIDKIIVTKEPLYILSDPIRYALIHEIAEVSRGSTKYFDKQIFLPRPTL